MPAMTGVRSILSPRLLTEASVDQTVERGRQVTDDADPAGQSLRGNVSVPDSVLVPRLCAMPVAGSTESTTVCPSPFSVPLTPRNFPVPPVNVSVLPGNRLTCPTVCGGVGSGE